MSDSLADKARKDFDEDGSFSNLSLADLAFRFNSGLYAATPKYADNWYYSPPTDAHLDLTLTQDRMLATAIQFPSGYTITRLGIEVRTAGGANSVVRLGLYSDDNGLPGELLVDGGTVIGDTIGTKEITLNHLIPLTGWYWIACAAQDALGPAVRAIRRSDIGGPSSTTLDFHFNAAQRAVPYVENITGVFPAIFGTPVSPTSDQMPRVAWRGTN